MSNDLWQTPQEIYDALDAEFHFTLDVACNRQNCKCPRGLYYETVDALKIDWVKWSLGGACWMNPPYSPGNIPKFCEKAYEESQRGCTVVAILPGDGSTGWFQNQVLSAHEYRYCKRRVRFVNPETGKKGGSPTFCSVIAVWKPGEVEDPRVSVWDWKEVMA